MSDIARIVRDNEVFPRCLKPAILTLLERARLLFGLAHRAHRFRHELEVSVRHRLAAVHHVEGVDGAGWLALEVELGRVGNVGGRLPS